MAFKIISDSSSNVLELSGVDYASVPLKINTSQAEFVDDDKLDLGEMLEALKNATGKTGTSCPNFQEWLDAFGEAGEVFAVTITSKLSGSFSAAQNAAREYLEEHPQRKAFVIDSLSAGPEMRLILEKLRSLISQGHPFETIKERITEYQQHTHTLFCLQSLQNLARNGRVNPAVAKLAGLLGIRMIGEAREGTIHPIHKPRGEKKALEILLQEMRAKNFAGARVCISHCFNREAAEKLKELILSHFPTSQVEIEANRGLCSFYAEAGGLIVGYEDAGVAL